MIIYTRVWNGSEQREETKMFCRDQDYILVEPQYLDSTDRETLFVELEDDHKLKIYTSKPRRKGDKGKIIIVKGNKK